MIMTKDRRGISCDMCGAEFRDRFDYYSAKIDKVVVDSQVQKVGIAEVDRRFLDIDICQSCLDKLTERMKEVISKRDVRTKKDVGNKASEWTRSVE